MSAGKPQPENDAEALRALLEAVSSGHQGSESRLLEVLYGELRAIAGSFFQTERSDHTLEPTALVHEAYVRLLGSNNASWQSRAHFIAVASKVMRHVLIDHARARRTQKRSGGQRVTLSGVLDDQGSEPVDAIDIHEQLERLEKIDARQARIVEMRFFGDMQFREIATVLGVSERAVHLDWRMASAWLRRELQKGRA
ncbi:MAG: sigma-70 family RNA polymerase sigma factor [Planctomycetes bacterium]|nr:sigma-70 family RNA polymerase sigma factor [Planctomycetota bacterium]